MSPLFKLALVEHIVIMIWLIGQLLLRIIGIVVIAAGLSVIAFTVLTFVGALIETIQMRY